jgi:hypothetical protein
MGVRSVLTDVLVVLGVWTFSGFFFAGVASAVALLKARPSADISSAATYGAAVGFVIGIPIAIAAIILLVGS